MITGPCPRPHGGHERPGRLGVGGAPGDRFDRKAGDCPREEYHLPSDAKHEKWIARHPLSEKTLHTLGLGLSRATGSATVSVRGDGASAEADLDKITKSTGLEVAFSPEEDAKVTLDLEEVPWKDAIEAIA